MTPFPFRFLYRCVVCSLKLQSIHCGLESDMTHKPFRSD
uniref:Uncharacterized protein n=1 Tax=Anguilla anguilla TaxID=7936 RepID=A0A0E9UF67_ANGAN